MPYTAFDFGKIVVGSGNFYLPGGNFKSDAPASYSRDRKAFIWGPKL